VLAAAFTLTPDAVFVILPAHPERSDAVPFRGTKAAPDMSKDVDGGGPPPGVDDFVLVRACQDGNDEAFGALVGRHQKKMLNIAYRMTGDHEAACDIVQDAFLSAYRAIRKFRGDAKFSTWLYGIVVNTSRTWLKQSHRGKMISMDDPATAPCGCVAAGSASALEVLERKEIQAAVQHCIEALDLEYQEVMVLRDTQGLAYEEIGRILGVPQGTIKSRLFRARDAVKNCLKRILGDL
jgi:RNA polymerase sigma-70 factor (ECF subfamily)